LASPIALHTCVDKNQVKALLGMALNAAHFVDSMWCLAFIKLAETYTAQRFKTGAFD
jgi:hypothetical protein